MNRALLTFCGGVLSLLVAGVGGLIWLSLRAGRLGDQLVQEANRQARAPWPRPARVEEPTPGSFGQGFASRAHRRRLLLEALRTLTEVHLARAEQGTWPEQLSPLVAGTFFLEADNSLEAWLVPSDAVSGVPELRLTARQPPLPQPRYAGGGLR